jgi:WD40 repeat protein
VKQRLRIFVSSPGDVKAAREVAALTIERLAQDYARFFTIEPYLWEYEAMVASGHFQDSIDPPSSFDVVLLILWSRLGTLLPEQTAIREYRGIDGRQPVTGTEWEFEEALQGARQRGAPTLLVYRKRSPASIDLRDAHLRERQLQQLATLDRFWAQHFVNQGEFIGGYNEFSGEAEFAASLETHLRKLIEKRIAELGLQADAQAARLWMQEPFRGLEPYEFEHAPIFFGQDEALAHAMVQLTANAEAGTPFLLVLGASGSGKSSLAKAGIVPKLFVPRRIPGLAFLRRTVFRPSDARPGEDLFDALVRRLTTQDGPGVGLSELLGPGQTAAQLAAHFRQSTQEPAYPIGFALGQITQTARTTGRMLEHEAARLVLVVDQLEELYTDEHRTPEERRRFVELLLGLVRSGLVWVIATMRKDFWHAADATPELVRIARGDGRLELLPPTLPQLNQIIRRPAAAAGLAFEQNTTTGIFLNEVMAEDVAQAPGALPLLSYVLDQLYRCDVIEAQGTTLTYVSYVRLGRLEGAIATKAEAVLEGCAPEDRPALSAVLFALVQMGASDAERAVSRRVPLVNFPPQTPQRRLVDALLRPDARLLVADSEADGGSTVRVAHEALITQWARAREFVQRNAQYLRIRRRLEERHALWRGLRDRTAGADGEGGRGEPGERTRFSACTARFGREPGLLTDIDLIDGRRLLRDHRPETEPHMVDFIERSTDDDRRIRNRSVRVLSGLAGVVTILALLAGTAGLIAVRNEHEAERQTLRTIEAQSRSLTEAADGHLRDGDVAGAQGIVLEVLAGLRPGEHPQPAAINVYQNARAADLELAVLSDGAVVINDAAFSADGRRLVAACNDNLIRIWDSGTGVLLGVLAGHAARVETAAFSADGARVVSAAADGTVRVWDAGSGRQLLALPTSATGFRAAQFSPDGRRIITAGEDGTARIWSTDAGAPLAVLSGHGDALNTATYSPDGQRIVTSSDDKTAKIWSAATGQLLKTLEGHAGSVSDARYSDDGRHIVTASYDKTARVWDAQSGLPLAVISTQRDILSSAAFSPDGARVLTASNDKTARIWDWTTGTQRTVLAGHLEAVGSARFSADGRRIVTASFDKTVRLWDATSNASSRTLSGHDNVVDRVAFARDGRRIATGSYDKTVRLWDVATARPLASVRPGDTVWSAEFSPDGRRLVTASGSGSVQIRDASTGVVLKTLEGHSQKVIRASYSPDGSRILTCSADGSARFWNSESGAQLASIKVPGIFDCAYSPDARRVVTAARDKTASIWDVASGAQLAVLAGHSGLVSSAIFSPDGRHIVTSSFDRTARIWDAETGKPLQVLTHDDVVIHAEYSPDGGHIVTAGGDKTARIWDAATGDQLAVLAGHGDAVIWATYSPDGRLIATASIDATARLWDAHVSADLSSQFQWSQAAQVDLLSDAVRRRLGLPPAATARHWPSDTNPCDAAAASPDDPDRVLPGISRGRIAAPVAEAACSPSKLAARDVARGHYQLGRALVAKRDYAGARREFESAVSSGYRAARVALADLLVDADAGLADRGRARALYEEAWNSGVPVAAYGLGRLLEAQSAAPVVGPGSAPKAAPTEAWAWYERGAERGEPRALARLGARAEAGAVAAPTPAAQNALLLDAFSRYAAAAMRARDEDWPDEEWAVWRHHRATLARLLGDRGLMGEVASRFARSQT